jgi:hypothetical protein
MSDRIQFSTDLMCPGCGHGGKARWEENDGLNNRGPERHLVGLSDGFRSAIFNQASMSGDPHLICGHCESVQPD